jgi:hypothetical protein
MYLFGKVTPKLKLLLRFAACSFILDNKEFFENYMTDFNEIRSKYMKSGVWVPDVILYAISRLAKRDFLLITDNDNTEIITDNFPNADFPIVPILHENQNQFTVLYPKEGEIEVGFPSDAVLQQYCCDPTLTFEKLQSLTGNNKKMIQTTLKLMPRQFSEDKLNTSSFCYLLIFIFYF